MRKRLQCCHCRRRTCRYWACSVSILSGTKSIRRKASRFQSCHNLLRPGRLREALNPSRSGIPVGAGVPVPTPASVAPPGFFLSRAAAIMARFFMLVPCRNPPAISSASSASISRARAGRSSRSRSFLSDIVFSFPRRASGMRLQTLAVRACGRCVRTKRKQGSADAVRRVHEFWFYRRIFGLKPKPVEGAGFADAGLLVVVVDDVELVGAVGVDDAEESPVDCWPGRRIGRRPRPRPPAISSASSASISRARAGRSSSSRSFLSDISFPFSRLPNDAFDCLDPEFT